MIVTGREIREFEAGSNDETGDHRAVFLTMGEVCIEGGPKGLRKLAKFLKDCARVMAKGSDQDHFHYNGNINTRPQIIVINKRVAEQHRAEEAYDIAADPEMPMRRLLWYVDKALSKVPRTQRRTVLDEVIRRRTPERTKAGRLREEAIRSILDTLAAADGDEHIDSDALIARVTDTIA